MTQAVILAAGQGTRLGALTAHQPKALLTIGGRPLIRWSLDHLAESGVSETLIVTGYRAEMIVETLGKSHRGMDLRFLHNPHYLTSGSMVSLLAAAPALDEAPFLVLECDILYERGFVDAAMTAREDVVLAAAVSGSGDEVYLCADPDGRISYLGKNAPSSRRAEAVGEFAGISRLSTALYNAYCDATRDSLEHGRSERHYEEVLFDISRRGSPLRVLSCPGLRWAEIDNAEDLGRATMQVLPALERGAEALRL